MYMISVLSADHSIHGSMARSPGSVVETFTGREAGTICESGARELPPETELSVPISVTRSPLAPARLIPYIGLWGLLPVSFSERAQMTKPFTLARVAAEVLSRIPRRKALSAWKARPSSVFTCPGRVGNWSVGRPSLM